jgi:hypothetical protein
MTEPAAPISITRTDLESGHWKMRCLTLKFKPDAFEAAGDLAEIVESNKIIMDYGCLLEAFVNRRWANERVFVGRQYLGESFEMLDRFMNRVLPHLEACFVGPEADWNDPRLTS